MRAHAEIKESCDTYAEIKEIKEYWDTCSRGIRVLLHICKSKVVRLAPFLPPPHPLSLSLSHTHKHTHTYTDKGALTLDALNGPAETAPKTKPAAAAAGGGSVGRVLAATRKDFLAELGEADVMGGVTAALTLVKATANQARAGL
jgi:hypothetical protein